MNIASRGVSCFSQPEFLADETCNLHESMIFLEAVGATRVVCGDPAAFVLELVKRWRAAYGLRATLKHDTPRDAIFISYAHADSTAAFNLAECLDAAQIPVWLDKDRLE